MPIITPNERLTEPIFVSLSPNTKEHNQFHGSELTQPNLSRRIHNVSSQNEISGKTFVLLGYLLNNDWKLDRQRVTPRRLLFFYRELDLSGATNIHGMERIFLIRFHVFFHTEGGSRRICGYRILCAPQQKPFRISFFLIIYYQNTFEHDIYVYFFHIIIRLRGHSSSHLHLYSLLSPCPLSGPHCSLDLHLPHHHPINNTHHI